MNPCSRNKLLVGLVNDEKQKRASREAQNKDYNVAGCVHPLRPQMTAKGYVPPGSSVAFAVEEACKSAGVRKVFMKRGIAQVGTRDFEKGVTVWTPVSRKDWDKRKLKEGELLRFRLLPSGGGGGGGGKDPTRTLLTITVAVLAIVASVLTYGATLPYFSTVFATAGAASAAASITAGLAGLAVSTIGMVLVNAIAPLKAPTMPSISRSNSSESAVYSIGAGKNATNPWGRVPVPLGRGRFAPPRAASPYTQTSGEDQYLHELFCLGIGDLEVSKLQIGTTAIEEFNEAQYEIFRYDPANPTASSLYPTGVYQEDLSVQLKAGVRNTRTTAECDRAELDFSFQGLTYINDDNSHGWASVDFTIQYRPKGGTAWSNVASRRYYNGRNFTIVASSVPSSTRDFVVYVDKENGTQIKWDSTTAPSGTYDLGSFRATKTTISYTEYSTYSYYGESYQQATDVTRQVCTLTRLSDLVDNPDLTEDGFGVTLTSGTSASEATLTVAGGYLTEISDSGTSLYVTYSGAQTRLKRETYGIKFPSRGAYDISVIRNTADSTDDRLINASYWGALRSMTNDNPVSTDYPVWLLALRIKASSQLSGAVDTLTVYYEALINDWDKTTSTWVKRYSSNPASIYRHIIQDQYAQARPQPDSLLDLPSIQEAHEYWDEKGWKYNLICDSSVGIFERLQSVCAAGLASPTMVDGKWAIIIDKPRTSIACAFTSANAWNWSFKRTQARLPNAIHATFVSEETWDNDLRVVKTDEPEGATYTYENQTYEGVNNRAQVYQLSRFHYADAKQRRRTISFTCYDESLLCTRGDLVDCAAPNISPYGLQTGRIRKIERDEDDNVVALYTDQTNTTDFSGRRFGVKVYNQEGAIVHAEVKSENLSQRKLTILYPQAMTINCGDKYAFGDYSEETFPAVVLGMKFNTDWTCEVTLQDYIEDLYGDLSQPIPEWKSVITKSISSKWELTSVPTLLTPITDEGALLQTSSGTIPRILVPYKHPVDLDSRTIGIAFDISISGSNSWTSVERNYALQNNEIYFSNVVEGTSYDIRVHYVGANGESGKYTYIKNINVIGRTTRPPAPSAVYLNRTVLTIQQNIRPLDVVGHKVYYVMDEEDDFATAEELTNPYTVTGTFELKPWAGKARAVFVKTVDELGYLSDYVRLVVDLGDVSTQNILFQTSEKDNSWSGDIVGGYTSSGTLFSEENVARYAQDNSVAAYPQDNSFAFYPSGVVSTLTYTWAVDIPSKYKGARILVTPETTSGKMTSLVFRHYYDVARYPQTSTDAAYPQNNDTVFYPQPTVSDWVSMPEEYYTPGSEKIEMKITYSPTEQAQIQDIKTIIDVEDLEDSLQDVAISATGLTRVTIPSSKYHAITSVVFGLQYEEGSSAFVVKYAKGTETLDTDGYIVLGPYVKAFDASGNLTSANCDIRVRGY